MSKFNNLLKMSAFFLSAQKRKEIIVPKLKAKILWDENDPNYQWNINTEDGNSGQFNEGTYISNDSDNRSSFSWNEQLVPDLNDDENRFPKSPYQEAVEMMGDQKADPALTDEMFKIAMKSVQICSQHISKNWLPLTIVYTNFKETYKITGSSSIQRIFSIYKKYSTQSREIVKNLWTKDPSDKITKSIKTMEFVKNFFEDFKILFEIIKFENVSLELPAEHKWPIAEEFDSESGGQELITPKEDLSDLFSFLQDEIQETLEKLFEQIETFDKIKID